MPVHYLALGHLARDLTPDGPALGGSVAYAALTAQACGYAPAIFTAGGEDMPLGLLADVPIQRGPSAASTTFENRYNAEGRTQWLHAHATPLALDALPTDWRAPKVAHLAPIAHELPLPLAVTWQPAFVGLTPQGWLRHWAGLPGRVWASPMPPNDLPRADAIVLSLEDLAGDWALAQTWAALAPVIVVTQGKAGCTVFTRLAEPRHIPARPHAEVDPTGAGDVFAAAFFINLYETGDPFDSAAFANAVAGFSVTRPGLSGVPSSDEVGLCRVKPII